MKSCKRGGSTYSSFGGRLEDCSGSDQIVLSYRAVAEDNIATNRAAKRYVNVEDDELVKCNISLSSFLSDKENKTLLPNSFA